MIAGSPACGVTMARGVKEGSVPRVARADQDGRHKIVARAGNVRDATAAVGSDRLHQLLRRRWS